MLEVKERPTITGTKSSQSQTRTLTQFLNEQQKFQNV